MEENNILKNYLLLEEALTLAEQNNFDEAIKCCDDVISNDPNDIDAWELKAICYFAKNDFLESATCREKVIALDPNDDLSKTCRERCFKIIENDALMGTIKSLENLHENGILTFEEYSSMRRLALFEFYKEIRF